MDLPRCLTVVNSKGCKKAFPSDFCTLQWHLSTHQNSWDTIMIESKFADSHVTTQVNSYKRSQTTLYLQQLWNSRQFPSVVDGYWVVMTTRLSSLHSKCTQLMSLDKCTHHTADITAKLNKLHEIRSTCHSATTSTDIYTELSWGGFNVQLDTLM